MQDTVENEPNKLEAAGEFLFELVVVSVNQC